MIFYDTETCGLHSVPVLIQYAIDDGPIILYTIWDQPISLTLNLIEMFMNHKSGLVGFNLAYDHFQLCKIYTILHSYHDHSVCPEDIVDELAELEMGARDGPCLKPVTCCDLFLHARKTKYQSTMDRGDIRIKRVPTALAFQLAGELEARIKLKDIYFARKKDKYAAHWNVMDLDDGEGGIDKNFKDIVLKFAPSSALKALAVDALGINPNDITQFGDIQVDKVWHPVEVGYAPFAKATPGASRFDWKGTWPAVVLKHHAHWKYHESARRYAAMDVDYTRRLYHYFGSPAPGDDDSILACAVAAARWRGFKIDIPKLKTLRDKAVNKIKDIPTAPRQVKYYIYEKLTPTEQLIMGGSTKKVLLEKVATLTNKCPKCNNGASISYDDQDVHPDIIAEVDDLTSVVTKLTVVNAQTVDKDCKICNGTGQIPHPGAARAREVLDARAATKEIELYDKLIQAGRFHASMKIIGALSGRMSGADGLNPQGIKQSPEVRSCFPLAWDVLSAGDFAGFEVTLAEASYGDPVLRRDLLTCEDCQGEMEFVSSIRDFKCKSCGGKNQCKIHGLFGVHVYPNMTYKEIMKTKGRSNGPYDNSKRGIFALFYGGEGFTLAERLGVDIETANAACAFFFKRYKVAGHERAKTKAVFCSMTQPGGIGTKVVWRDPEEYVESMFGFRRYFTLENMICKTLFQLADNPPKAWEEIKIKVMRRDREQLATGAVRSALFAAAFNMQGQNLRAAINHRIQSSGAQVTKRTQRAICDLQPAGIHPWLVQTLNIHDEIQVSSHSDYVEKVEQVVYDTVESIRPTVPLIKIDWGKRLKTWADK